MIKKERNKRVKIDYNEGKVIDTKLSSRLQMLNKESMFESMFGQQRASLTATFL